jgi:AraC-like DNA-binding protein
LEGGEVLTASNDFAKFCIQEFDGGNFLMHYSVVETKAAFAVNARRLYPGIHALIMLKNEVSVDLINGKNFKLSEGQFTLLHADELNMKIRFPQEQLYICFGAVLSPELASSLVRDFPEFSAGIKHEPFIGNDILVNPPAWTDEEVKEHIRYVLTYSDPQKWRRNYFENRVWDIVWKLIGLQLKQEQFNAPITEDEKQRGYSLQRLILDSLDSHIIVKDLARKVQSNETAVKKIFSRMYGMGIHEYRMYERLKLAIKLLNEGMMVKEAAAEAGWAVSNLIRAYKKIYGTTPSTVKKTRR